MPKIYTRTGDQGHTTLGNGQRVDKDHHRIELCGTLDELNSYIGLLLTDSLTPDISQQLLTIQHDLIKLGSELSCAVPLLITADHTIALENSIDMISQQLPPLQTFIIPGGTPESAHCHIARTLCRRAERHLVTLNRLEPVNPASLMYLNRLSDLLFVMARQLLVITAGKNPLEKTCTEKQK